MSPGDWASFATLGMFLLTAGGLAYKASQDRVRKAEQGAVVAALTDQRNKELEVKQAALEKTVDGLGQQLVSHRIEFGEFKGQNEEQHKAVGASLDRLGRNVEQLQSQVRMKFLGTADQALELKSLKGE